MLTVDKCCCGCSLRTGSIMISIFYLCLSGVASGLIGSFAVTQKDPSMKILLICMATLYGIQFMTDILLLVAIFGEKFTLIVPWLIIHIIKCALMSIGYLTASIKKFISPEGPFIAAGVISILIMIAGVGLQVYFILVVYSFYKDITRKE